METLISVRDLTEAREAVEAGARMIDLKEPEHGALGGIAPAQIGPIVALLRRLSPDCRISATTGDPVPGQSDEMLARAAEVAAQGVDYVKVGVGAGPDGMATLHRLAAAPWQTVPVFLVDQGLALDRFDAACRLDFPAVMVDTDDKRRGNLFDCVTDDLLAESIAIARRQGRQVGLSGSLREGHLPRLVALGPDFAGFRGAVCARDRTARLEGERVAALITALRDQVRIHRLQRDPAASGRSSEQAPWTAGPPRAGTESWTSERPSRPGPR